MKSSPSKQSELNTALCVEATDFKEPEKGSHIMVPDDKASDPGYSGGDRGAGRAGPGCNLKHHSH